MTRLLSFGPLERIRFPWSPKKHSNCPRSKLLTTAPFSQRLNDFSTRTPNRHQDKISLRPKMDSIPSTILSACCPRHHQNTERPTCYHNVYRATRVAAVSQPGSLHVQSRVNNLRAELDSATRTNHELISSINALENQIEGLNREKRELKAESRFYQSQTDQLGSELEATCLQRDAIQERYSQLLVNKRVCVLDNEKMAAVISTMEGKIDSITATCDSLHRKTEELACEKNEMESDISTMLEDIKKLIINVDSITVQRDEALMEARRMEMGKMEAEKIQARQEKELAGVKQNMQAVSNQRDELLIRCTKMSTQPTFTETQMRELAHNRNELKVDIQKLQQQLIRTEKNLNMAQDENKSLRRSIKPMEEKCFDTDRNNYQLQQSLSKVTHVLEKNKANMDSQQVTISRLENETSHLRQKLSLSEQHRAEISAKTGRKEAEIRERQKTMEAQSDLLEAGGGKIKLLENKLMEAECKRNKLERELESLIVRVSK